MASGIPITLDGSQAIQQIVEIDEQRAAVGM
jgi:hypothetical protein